MTCFQILISLTLLFTTAASATRPPPSTRRCGAECRFVICGFRQALISHPSIPITRPICRRRNKPIGQILSVREAIITPRRRLIRIPISRLRFNRTTPYRPNFIFPVRSDHPFPNVSSLAVRSLPRRAMKRLEGACVKVPIRKWVEGGIQRTGKQCVAFNVRVPTIVVELQWDSNDDLDLFVTEPDGTGVFFQGGDGSGRLLKDVGRRNCGSARRVGGKETIIYYPNQDLKRGRYLVSAEHTKSCMEGATAWEMRVAVKGRLVRRIGGVSRLQESGVIPDSGISFVVY